MVNLEGIEKALLVVRREMDCRDAHLEIGGAAPESPTVVHAETPSGYRLVAIFDEPPEDPAAAGRRLRQLASAFFESSLSLPSIRPDAEQHLAQRRLDDELSALSGRTGAVGASVIDVKSPVLWGSSEARHQDEDVEVLTEIAQLDQMARDIGEDLALVAGLGESDRQTALDSFSGEDRSRIERLVGRLEDWPLRTRRKYLLHARALAAVRSWASENQPRDTSLRRLNHEPGLSYLARSFAGIYVLVLYFSEPFSELHVEGMALHALPLIERYVLSLPPVDPDPPRGRVVRMPLPKQ